MRRVEAETLGRKVGPAEARLIGGYEAKGESKGPYVKGVLSAEQSGYKVEGYAKARINDLDPLESDALEARMRLNAVEARERREDGMATMERIRARAEQEWAATQTRAQEAAELRRAAQESELRDRMELLRMQRDQRIANSNAARANAFGTKPPEPPMVPKPGSGT